MMKGRREEKEDKKEGEDITKTQLQMKKIMSSWCMYKYHNVCSNGFQIRTT